MIDANDQTQTGEEAMEPGNTPEAQATSTEAQAPTTISDAQAERPMPPSDGQAQDPMPPSDSQPEAFTPKPASAFLPPQPAPVERSGPTVIALANQKGGVAKTTTTLNLAVAFAEEGKRALCIDMDPQGNLTMSQGLDPDQIECSMYNVLLGQASIRQVIHKREIDVAVSAIDLAGAELAMASMIGRERALQKALLEVKDDYDVVFIDTPPSLGLLTINALTASNKVIVPVQCEYLSMRGLLQLQNTLAMIREHLNPEIEIQGILPTMLDTRTLHAQEAIELLEENFSGRVFRSRINRTVRFAEAPVQGMSVLKYEPHGSAAQSYRDLAQEVMAGVK